MGTSVQNAPERAAPHASCATSDPDAAPTPTINTRFRARSPGTRYADECITFPGNDSIPGHELLLGPES